MTKRAMERWGYGNEYPKGLSCSTLASTHNALYEHYLAHPLHPNGPRARALLQKDIVTKAATAINQYATKELTAQQFNALSRGYTISASRDWRPLMLWPT